MKRLVPVLAVLAALTATPAAHAAAKPAKTGESEPAAVDSLKLLERQVARDSSKFDLVYRLGVMYLDREDMLNAATTLMRANKLRPKDVKVLVNLGVALDALGKPEDAQGYYHQALDVAPGDSVATCRLASSMYAQGKYGPSIDMLRGLIQAKPKSYCAYFTLGVAFADAGIYRDAINMWRKVIELAPQSPEAQSAKESIDVLEKFLNAPATPGAAK